MTRWLPKMIDGTGTTWNPRRQGNPPTLADGGPEARQGGGPSQWNGRVTPRLGQDNLGRLLELDDVTGRVHTENLFASLKFSTISFLKRTPSAVSLETTDSKSSTIKTNLDQPPGLGIAPSGIGWRLMLLAPRPIASSRHVPRWQKQGLASRPRSQALRHRRQRHPTRRPRCISQLPSLWLLSGPTPEIIGL